jgi:hypothetical protein
MKSIHCLRFCLVLSTLVTSTIAWGWEKCRPDFQPPSPQVVGVGDPFTERLFFPGSGEKVLEAKWPSVKNPFSEESARVKKVGPFLIDERLDIGVGDEGRVYLAWHLESKILVAAKEFFYMSVESVEEAGDYVSLKKLNRLYGCFFKKSSQRETAIFFTTYASGRNFSRSIRGKSIKEQIKSRLKTSEAYISELSYLAARGVDRYDWSNPFIWDSQEKALLAVDFGKVPYVDHRNSISEDKYFLFRSHVQDLLIDVERFSSRYDHNDDWYDFISKKNGFLDLGNLVGRTKIVSLSDNSISLKDAKHALEIFKKAVFESDVADSGSD